MRGYACCSSALRRTDTSLDASKQPLTEHPSSKVAVSKSTIQGAGNGVFARADFEAGDIITAYNGTIMSSSGLNWKDVIEYAQMLKDEGMILVGSKDDCNVLNGVGHLINDAYQPPLHIIRWLKHSGMKHPVLWAFQSALIFAYYCASFSKSNCVAIENPHTMKVNMVATRHINAGEEIFYCYGFPYWDKMVFKVYPDTPENIQLPEDQTEEIEKIRTNMNSIAEYNRYCHYYFEMNWARRAKGIHLSIEKLRELKEDFINITCKLLRLDKDRLKNPLNIADAQLVLNWALWNVKSVGLITEAKKDDAEDDAEAGGGAVGDSF